MRPDLIITWPTGCDFPVWRNFLRENRAKFKDVFIIMSESHGKNDFTSFLVKSFEDMKVNVTIKRAGTYIQLEDWRNSAVHAALAASTSEWVWFTEQDFFIRKPDEFFLKAEQLAELHDVIYVTEGERIHPACMFVRRSVLDKTSRDFGIVPGKMDHFGKFVDELSKNNARMVEIGHPGKEYYHMNGLTHNYRLIEEGHIKNIYQPGLFQLYNAYARLQPVPQDPNFIYLTYKVDLLLAPISRFFMGKA